MNAIEFIELKNKELGEDWINSMDTLAAILEEYALLKVRENDRFRTKDTTRRVMVSNTQSSPVTFIERLEESRK